MKNKLAFWAGIFVLVSYTSSVMAEVTWVPSIAYQHRQLSFDQTYGKSGGNPSVANFDVTLPMVNVSLTAAVNKFYVSAKYETSITEATTSVDETDRVALYGQANLIAIDNSQTDIEREDFSLTFGYNVWRRLNVFAGYLSGKTTITPEPAVNLDFFFNPDEYNRAWLMADEVKNFGQSRPTYVQEYTEAGPFVGFSYAWTVGEVGTLSASFAYADMDGKYEDNAQCANDFFTTGNDCYKYKWEGDSTGTSIGMTWTQPLTDHVAYFIDLRQQSYEMEGVDKTGAVDYTALPAQVPIYEGTVETKEEMTSLTMGIQMYF